MSRNFEQDQRFLLNGIASTAWKIHRIDDMDVFSLKHYNERVVLKRVIKALLHDAAKMTVALPPRPRQIFKAAVDMATAVRTEEELEAFKRFVNSYRNPELQAVEAVQTPLWEE